MTKTELVEMGLTTEQADKVFEKLDGAFVTKSRFNEINEALKESKKNVSDRDAQLAELKKTAGNSEELNAKIEKLQAENKAAQEAHEANLKTIKTNAAVERALLKSKARNAETVKPLLRAFLDKAELKDDDIVGLDDEIKKLIDDKSTQFLFDNSGGAPQVRFIGGRPQEKADTQTGAPIKTLNDAIRAQYIK